MTSKLSRLPAHWRPVAVALTAVVLAVAVWVTILPSGAAPDAVAPSGPPPPDVQRLIDRAAANGPVRVIVRLRTSWSPGDLAGRAGRQALRSRLAADRAPVVDAFRRRGASPATFDDFPFVAGEADAPTLRALQSSGSVAAITEDVATPPVLADSTGPKLLDSAAAVARGVDGRGTIVAILDTGVDTSHPFLAGRAMLAAACFSAKGNCPNGQVAQTGDGAGVACTYTALCAHGTEVAGIAVGRRSTTGTFDGVAPGARYIPIQVYSKFTGTDCGPTAAATATCTLSYTSDQLKAFQYVYQLFRAGETGIVSINLSTGGNTVNTTDCDGTATAPHPLKAAIDALRAVKIASVIAAGNNNFKNGVSDPGCVSSAITVGATTKADAVWVDPPSLGYGSNSSNQVELLAPGLAITTSRPGGGWATERGTSLAAPHVAGAWALYRQLHPEASVDTVLKAFRDTGVKVTDPANGVTVPRLDLTDALKAPETTAGSSSTSSSTAPAT